MDAATMRAVKRPGDAQRRRPDRPGCRYRFRRPGNRPMRTAFYGARSEFLRPRRLAITSVPQTANGRTEPARPGCRHTRWRRSVFRFYGIELAAHRIARLSAKAGRTR